LLRLCRDSIFSSVILSEAKDLRKICLAGDALLVFSDVVVENTQWQFKFEISPEVLRFAQDDNLTSYLETKNIRMVSEIERLLSLFTQSAP
jgi:hypothetical protein